MTLLLQSKATKYPRLARLLIEDSSTIVNLCGDVTRRNFQRNGLLDITRRVKEGRAQFALVAHGRIRQFGEGTRESSSGASHDLEWSLLYALTEFTFSFDSGN